MLQPHQVQQSALVSYNGEHNSVTVLIWKAMGLKYAKTSISDKNTIEN
jgi:hypothetical protein